MKLIVAMEHLRVSLPPDVQKLFGYGVALHSGGVLVGNKGSARRLDYGLVGDAVNEAARIESLTKHYGARLLISRETFAQLLQQGTRRLVDRIIVKGKSTPVELFERENLCTAKNYSELCRRYKAAYDEYFFGHFAAALAQFEKLVRNHLTQFLRQRGSTAPTAPPARPGHNAPVAVQQHGSGGIAIVASSVSIATLAGRCTDLAAEPPANWDGIWKMEGK